jgi:hypothetical protein
MTAWDGARKPKLDGAFFPSCWRRWREAPQHIMIS